MTKKTKNREASFKVFPFLENTNLRDCSAKKVAKLRIKLKTNTVYKKKKQLQACFSKDTARDNTMSGYSIQVSRDYHSVHDDRHNFTTIHDY